MTRIVFMGTPDFSVPILKQLLNSRDKVIAVVTQPDRPVGRKKIVTAPPVKEEAEKHGIPVYQPEKLRKSPELTEIIALEPDIIVTAAYGQILPKNLLDTPKYGCINVHASLLPELRGGAPIHYAIMQGKEKTGVTIMYMAEKLDAGDILTQVEVPILETDNVGTLHDKLSAAGAELLAATLPKLLQGKLTPIPQQDELATYAKNITREQEKINWLVPGTVIFNHIRGLNPWPVAYTTLKGSVLKIWKAEKLSYDGKPAVPGEVLRLDEGGLLVATADQTAINITELQPSGKKKMTVAEYYHGIGAHLTKGMCLGE
ncbi:methionyl-tRNA formyltransferase [Bacillaceae bacterium Marseille-Q3522]|nr:methionyl-tRNA formyltransferase [Bacillaceae bacterium Marseille-Q3522]